MEEFAAADDARGSPREPDPRPGERREERTGADRGLERGRIVEKQRAADAGSTPGRRRSEWHAAVAAHDELVRQTAARRDAFERSFLLESAGRSAVPLRLALTLARWAGEKEKSDLEREPQYMERNRGRLADSLSRAQSELHAGADAALFADWLARAAALPAASGSRRWTRSSPVPTRPRRPPSCSPPPASPGARGVFAQSAGSRPATIRLPAFALDAS